MFAAVGEREPGPGDEIGHGARHQHLAGGCITADAARAFDGNAADPFAGCDVALAGVQAEGSGAAETRTGGGQRARTGDGSSRPVERRQEFSAAEREAAAAEPADFPLYVRFERQPRLVVGPIGLDARPEDRREHSIRQRLVSRGSEERTDAIEHGVLIANERQVVLAGELDELRARHEAGYVASLFDEQCAIAGAMQHQRRHAHVRQDMADVDLRVHLRQGERRAGARALAQVVAPPLAERGIRSAARRPCLDAHRPAPVRADLVEEALASLGVGGPWVVGRPRALGVGADHDQRARPFRIGRREQAAQRPALGHAHQHRLP